MNIKVKLFAAARQIAGQSDLHLVCSERATIADVRRQIVQKMPELEALIEHVRFAVNAEYASDQTQVTDHDEIACIPPVSGG